MVVGGFSGLVAILREGELVGLHGQARFQTKAPPTATLILYSGQQRFRVTEAQR